MDGSDFHGEILFFKVDDKLVQSSVILPYRCVEIGGKPHDALARRWQKGGLLGDIEECS